jgi:hypothetical protein
MRTNAIGLTSATGIILDAGKCTKATTAVIAAVKSIP